jgi:hypothetical protein
VISNGDLNLGDNGKRGKQVKEGVENMLDKLTLNIK